MATFPTRRPSWLCRRRRTGSSGTTCGRRRAAVEARTADRADAVDTAFAEWLATGEHRTLRSPLEDDSQWMRLDLDAAGGPVFELEGQRHPVVLEGGAQIEAGPQGHAALRFEDKSWAGLPPVPLDTDTPFSIALWIHQPEEEGNYVVAGQYDADDDDRGWSMNIGSRQLSFRMTGEPDPDGEGRPAPRVAPSNLRRLPPGEWTHIVITHDGTGERAGMNVFQNGDVVEASGSEYFTRAVGSIRTGLPLELGRGRTRGARRTRRAGDALLQRRRRRRPARLQPPAHGAGGEGRLALVDPGAGAGEASRCARRRRAGGVAALLPERQGRAVSRARRAQPGDSSASGARCAAAAASPM